MIHRLLIAASFPILFSPASAMGQEAPQAVRYAMPGTQVFDIRNARNEAYRIFVSVPDGPAPEQGFPVLYVLDGNAMFAGFAEARRVQERPAEPGTKNRADSGPGEMIVVGIGYPTDQAYEGARRLYDFTPPNPPTLPPVQTGLAKVRAGGRDDFLSFLLDTVRPEIARRFKVDSNRQALYGHSLAGYFALHMLYTHPDAFSSIIAASPSQWWNDQAVLAEERAFIKRLESGQGSQRIARLLLLAGDREEFAANTWDTQALAERLKPLSAYGLRSKVEIFEGETHLTVPSRSVTTALRWAAARP